MNTQQINLRIYLEIIPKHTKKQIQKSGEELIEELLVNIQKYTKYPPQITNKYPTNYSKNLPKNNHQISNKPTNNIIR